MRPTLVPGMRHTITYRVGERELVNNLFPEVESLHDMPKVLATAYMVGLFEWACTELVAMHLDEGEGSVGTLVDFTHKAATPPGMTVTVACECIEVEGGRIRFRVEGHDGIDVIGGGLHERHVIKKAFFDARIEAKRKRAGALP